MARANKCANAACSAVCQHDKDKLFRVDVNLGNAAGNIQRKTLYVWLCAKCAREMNPKIEVAGNTVTVLLAYIRGNPVLDHRPASAWVN